MTICIILDEVLSFGGLFLRVIFMVPDPRSISSRRARKCARSARSTHALQIIPPYSQGTNLRATDQRANKVKGDTAVGDEQEARTEVLRDVNFMSLTSNPLETDVATMIEGIKLQRWT